MMTSLWRFLQFGVALVVGTFFFVVLRDGGWNAVPPLLGLVLIGCGFYAVLSLIAWIAKRINANSGSGGA